MRAHGIDVEFLTRLWRGGRGVAQSVGVDLPCDLDLLIEVRAKFVGLAIEHVHGARRGGLWSGSRIARRVTFRCSIRGRRHGAAACDVGVGQDEFIGFAVSARGCQPLLGGLDAAGNGHCVRGVAISARPVATDTDGQERGGRNRDDVFHVRVLLQARHMT
jgi:hypothetical protein